MSNDDQFDIDPELEHELMQLGPLALRQEEAEAQEPDAQFISSLRARLVGEPTTAAEPVSAQPLSHPVTLKRPRRFRPPVFLGGLLTAAVAAAILAIVINSHTATSPGTGTKPSAFALPTPNPTELGRTYPVRGLGGGGGPPKPWQTEAQIPQGSAYPAHLSLSASGLRYGPKQLQAYELEAPALVSGRLTQIAHSLGISAPVKRSSQPDGTWAYTEQDGTSLDPSTNTKVTTIHSVAINLRTGYLIYHDTRKLGAFSRSAPVNAPGNVAYARAFLTHAGWPGATMPIHPAMSPQEGFLQNLVTLGWASAGETDTPEAVLILAPGGIVVDATIWPPIARSASVPVRGYPNAWKQVQSGKVAVSVDITAGFPDGLKGGVGVVTKADTLDVLTTTPKGQSYLAPAYRFRGTVKIKRIAPEENWVSVAPAPR